MTQTIALNEEEIAALDHLIHKDLEERHSELRRTRNPGFRDEIKRKIALEEHVLEELEHAGTTPQSG